jgi:hypothetical protein
VRQAKEAAGPLRRSTAGQIEYWATLGRVVEHSGLSAQEARAAIEGYETDHDNSLQSIKAKVLMVSTNGNLQAHIGQIVTENRRQLTQRPAA